MKGKRMKSTWVLACCLGLATSLSAQLSKQELAKQEVLKHTNTKELNRLSEKFANEYKANKAKALEMAKEKNWLTRKEYSDGTIVELQGVDKSGKPIYEQTYNRDAAETTSTDLVYPGGSMGLSLTGQGMTIGEWDGGAVRTSHQEFGGRAFQADNSTSYSNHATHVAGTLIGGGVVAAARGMAYQASLDAYDWSNDNSEMTNAAANGLLISNHSYGTIAGWRYDNDDNEWYWYGDVSLSTTEDYNFGYYNYWDAESWDEIAYNAPYYLIVKSAGNDRGDNHNGQHYVLDNNGNWVSSSVNRDADGGPLGYDCISTGGNAKNILTVGAVGDISGGYSVPNDVNMSSFSGWGPTDDGRIKPDIVGNGVGVYSAYADNNSDYASISGTSMSGPNVAGSMLLLQQHYLNEEGAYMRSASLKGLVIHTADEAGTADGPDYIYGWGLLNTAKAAAFISNPSKTLVEANLQGGTTYQQVFFASGNDPIRATLCWTDVKYNSLGATLNSTAPTLINDLDIRIEDASGTIYQPYILNPASPNSAATTGDNFRDNVEQIYIDVPTSGLYTITITHKNNLTGGSQDFSLLYEGGDVDPNAFCGSWEDAWAESTGSAQSSGFALTRDASGNTYVAGRFIGDLTIGGTTISSGNSVDMYLIKYNATN
ncbi:MAG: S8 family serine peptidase, partial [Saprospiraceae bacterium]|nr:S8 family serine peptidase [Saprospiraceae bacterium]